MARPINTTKNQVEEQVVIEQPNVVEPIFEEDTITKEKVTLNTVKKQPKTVDKMYRLTESSKSASYLIKSGRNKKLIYTDPETGYNRAIRYCPNETSIYIDEQSEHAVVDEICFEKGNLEVPKTNKVLQDFLDRHPGNAENGGNIFELVDYAKEADDIVEEEELIAKIREAVRLKGNDEDGVFWLEMVASVLEGSLDSVSAMKLNELKRVIYFHIEDDPYYFVDGDTLEVNIFDDLGMVRKYTTLKAIKENVIKRSNNGRSILWAKGNKEIITAPFGIDPVEHFAEFLASTDGILVFAEIEKRLKL